MFLGTSQKNPLHGKSYFLFPDALKRWYFQKNRAAIRYFLYYRERSRFFYPKIWSYTLGGKWWWSFSKKYTEIRYCLQTIWKDGLFKRDGAGTWSFFSYLERWYFFPENMIFFPWPGSESRSFSRNTWKYDIFCVQVRVLQTWCHALLSKKIQRWSYLAKMHLKVIDILDWHPRKSSSNFLYFHGDLYEHFHLLLSSEKTRKLNM